MPAFSLRPSARLHTGKSENPCPKFGLSYAIGILRLRHSPSLLVLVRSIN